MLAAVAHRADGLRCNPSRDACATTILRSEDIPGLQECKVHWSVRVRSSMCSMEALDTAHAQQKNRTPPLQQRARHAPQPLTEGYICARERLTRAQVVASGSGRDAGQAHASDTTCTGGLQWQLAPSKSQTCRRLTVPRTQWAPGRIPASRRKAFGKH